MMSTYYLRGGLALPLNSRHDPAKKGILGILTDDRPRKREASEVGESLNFFTLGSLKNRSGVRLNRGCARASGPLAERA